MKMDSLSYKQNSGWSVPLTKLNTVDSTSTVLFIFGSQDSELLNTVILELTEIFPNSIFVGCSSAGEIFNNTVSDDSVSVGICQFEKTKVVLASTYISKSENSFEIGKKLGTELHTSDLSAVFVLSDGLNINGSALALGLQSVCQKVPITGGLAADGSRFEKTWIIHNKKVEESYVVALGFYGSHIQIEHGSKGGWDIFGVERKITRSIGNVLYELDGQPALDLYIKYLGDKAIDLPASALLFPLQLRDNAYSKKKIVRTILSIDRQKKSMTFAGDVPENSLAQLMRANLDRLIDGATDAAQILIETATTTKPKFVIAVSCVGRRLVLRDRSEEEVLAVQSLMPPNSHLVGFYSYGELCPFEKNEMCELHNQTMTLTSLSESE